MSTRNRTSVAVWLFSTLSVAVLLSSAAAASPMGQAAAEQVSQAIYQDYLNTWLYTHTGHSRGMSGAQHDPARDNIKALFESFGLPAHFETFTYSGQTWENVVAELKGSVYPERIYIVGGHYDSVNNPGADDNASGVASVIECARILSQYESDCTLRFIAFDMEEQGLIGSSAYVNQHKTEDIRGMISADMVAYDPSTNTCNIYGRTSSNPIKQALAAAVTEYGGLSYILQGQLDASNHAPFEGAGFQACLLIEGQVWTNPYYHTQQDCYDSPGYLNFPYAVKMTRSLVGWMVDAAGVQVVFDGLKFTYPDGRPEYSSPAGGTQVRVEVSGMGAAVPQPGTGKLHYDLGSGWQAAAMAVVADNVYDALLPAAPCGTTVKYYVSAETTTGQLFFDPYSAPAAYYTALAAYGLIIVQADEFETDLGWTVGDTGDTATTGKWTREAPQGTAAQPGTDHSAAGTKCWVTDYKAGSSVGDYDVDNGKTTLKSPIFDLTKSPDAVIGYWRWYSNDQGSSPNTDIFKVDISNDGGGTWKNAETVGPAGAGTSGGWFYHEFKVADVVAVTAQIRLRFVAADDEPGSIVEAAIDDFQIYMLDCTGQALGDLNCDGKIDAFDIDPFVLALTDPAGYEVAWPDCDWLLADINGDGKVDAFDIDPFVELLTGG